MSEKQVSDDASRAFRFVLAAIAAVVALGLVVLITVVVLYRVAPGRHFPFIDSTPSAPIHSPTPG